MNISITQHMTNYLANMDYRVMREYNFPLAEYDTKFGKPFVQYVLEQDASSGEWLKPQFCDYAELGEGDEYGEQFYGTERMVAEWYLNKFMNYLFCICN